MKSLLFGMLVLGSFSTFAVEYNHIFFGTGDIHSNVVNGYNFPIKGSQKNADFFCLSKGFDKSTEILNHNTLVNGEIANILPNGDVVNKSKNTARGTMILYRVKCSVEVKD